MNISNENISLYKLLKTKKKDTTISRCSYCVEFSSSLCCCIKLRVVVVEILRRPACYLPSVVVLNE